MKKFRIFFLTVLAALIGSPAQTVDAQRVVIVHTNDTHSQIDPVESTGLGGVARRKVLIDSIRSANRDVILVDAGDAVQGSVFYTVFKGEVEQRLLYSLGYDLQIVGNHEFDNGLEALARQYQSPHAKILATNYDFSATPLAGKTIPWEMREYDGKKIAFFAANINPKGLIEDDNFKGLEWLDTQKASNAMAWYLKHIAKADKVVAITHIGYDDINGTNDIELARNSEDIDLIIGGHSHTLLDPQSPAARIPNAKGDTILVLQTKNKGQYLGEVVIDFDRGGEIGARLIPVDSRLDSRIDGSIEAIVAPYRAVVDSISNVKIGRSAARYDQNGPELLNWLSDFVLDHGRQLTGTDVDIAIMNKGGIRTGLSKGTITKGMIMAMLPFNNNIEVIEISGRDLLDNLEIMAGQGGNGVSRGTDVVYDAESGKIIRATIDGQPIDPDKTYRLATISYLAKGGDYMTPLKHGKTLAISSNVIFNDIIQAMEKGKLKGKVVKPDTSVRMRASK